MKLFSWAVVVGLLVAVVFMLWPEIDLNLSAWFSIAHRVFLFDNHIAPLAVGVQRAASVVTWLAIIVAIVGIGVAVARKRHLLGLRLSHWLFLFLALVLGPAFLVNNVLKEHSGRPRPVHLAQFGGPHSFTPIFHAGECKRNCSFVSGEAASIYALGFAIAMLSRRRRETILIATVLAGSVVGFIRMAQGAHFLSDIIFAGVFMAIVVVFLHWFVFDIAVPRLGVAQGGEGAT